MKPRTIIRRAWNFVLLLLAGAAGWLPLSWLRAIGAVLGVAAYYLTPLARRVTLANLRQAFAGQLGERQLRELAVRSYCNLGQNVVEFLKLPHLAARQLLGMVCLSGREHLETALAGGRGAVILSGHLGNWELIAPSLVALGYRASVIARDQVDPELTELFRRVRESTGTGVISHLGASREALRRLRRNELVGIMCDMNAGPGGILVDFFGRQASTTPAAVALAMRSGAAMLPVFASRRGFGRLAVEIMPPLDLECTGDRQADLVRNTTRVSKLIEHRIRCHPEQWFWLNHRWKIRESRGSKHAAWFGARSG